jgi:hypothetical protein
VLQYCSAVRAQVRASSNSDASGKKDLSASPETLQIDLADCKVLEAYVRAEAGTFFNTSSARMAFDNCMRSKGYIKS